MLEINNIKSSSFLSTDFPTTPTVSEVFPVPHELLTSPPDIADEQDRDEDIRQFKASMKHNQLPKTTSEKLNSE